MMENENKEFRKQKISDNRIKKEKISEEQRFVSKTKKQFKRQIEDMKVDELWEDWENEIY